MLRAMLEKAITFFRGEEYGGRHRFARNLEYYVRVNNVKVIFHSNKSRCKRAIATLQRDLQKRQRRAVYGI